MTGYKTVLFVAVVFGAIAIAFKDTHSRAAEDTPAQTATKCENLQVVGYASGLTGFFDRSNGRLYLYASDLTTPFMTVEIKTLGEPLKIIKAPPGQ